MKKIVLAASIVFTIILAGCSETTDEITFLKDGSGVLTTTNDMSMLISMLKTMGGADMGDMGEAVDTSFSLAAMAEKDSTLGATEKELLKKGRITIKMSMEDEKMFTKFEVPFSSAADIDKIKALTGKLAGNVLGKSANLDGMPPGIEDKMPSSDPTGAYFSTTYAKGLIERKVNKEKYARLEEDAGLKTLKEMAENGLSSTNSVVINLPSPAKSVTGKNATLSEDKKKVTITTTTEDFFDDASALEFRIEY